MEAKASTVSFCEVSDCAYNKVSSCHAIAVTIGEVRHPACLTFYKSRGGRGGAPSAEAMIGACKMENCSYNVLLGCTAGGVTVVFHHGHADCDKYAVR